MPRDLDAVPVAIPDAVGTRPCRPHVIGVTTRQPVAIRDRMPIEELTMQRAPAEVAHDWSHGVRANGSVVESLYPLAGDDVLTPDGTVGTALHTCHGAPRIPRDCRYVHSDGQQPIAFHVSWLRPAPVKP